MGDAEREFHAAGVPDIFEIDEHALRGFGAEVGDGRAIGHGADVRLEHHVEGAGLGEATGFAGAGGRDEGDLVGGGLGEIFWRHGGEGADDGLPALKSLGGGLELRRVVLALQSADVADDRTVDGDRGKEELVSAETLFGDFAVHEWVAEAGDVAGGLPDLRVHDNGGFDADDVFAAADHVVPPAVADVFLELAAEGAVVEETVEAAVDFGGLEDETAALRERDDAVHGDSGRGGGG